MSWRDVLGELGETVSYIIVYAPDFPYRDHLPAEGQMTLDRVYQEMRDHLMKVADGHGESPEIVECRRGIEESYDSYRQGDIPGGCSRIQQVLHILYKL